MGYLLMGKRKLTVPRGFYPKELRIKSDKAWQHMKSRCYNKNNEKYARYGARGITIEISQGDFINWYCSGLMKSDIPLKEATIGRIDHDKGYNFSNMLIQSRSANSKEMHTRHNDYSKLNSLGTSAVRKKVLIIDAKTREPLMICESITEAAKFIGSKVSNAAAVLSKKPHCLTLNNGLYSLEHA